MAKSIIDDPSQWTRKPKDIFDAKVKESLDNRGWGTADTESDDTDTGGDVPRSLLVAEHQLLRKRLEEIVDLNKSVSTTRGQETYSLASRALRTVPKR